MSGYIGTKAAVVTPGAERKKVFSITTTTSSLTGLAYTPGFVHVFHNGVRLVDGTDYTATNGTSITLTTAAQNGDEVVVISYATFQVADAYTKAESDARYVNVTGDTMTGALIGTNLTLSGGVYLGGTGSANLLDDYEEGTYTPSLNGSFTYAGLRNGEYTVVGNLCTVTVGLGWTANASSSVHLNLTLPFTCNSVRSGAALGYLQGLDTANVQVVATVGLGGTSVGFWRVNDNAAPTAIDASACSGSGEIQITISYRI